MIVEENLGKSCASDLKILLDGLCS
jgi:hypothetical protein